VKNNSSIIQIILAIAIVVLYILHFTGNKNNSTKISETPLPSVDSTAKITLTELPDFSIVYINSDTLMEKYELVTDMKQKLETRMKDYENSFQAKLKKFEKDVQSFQESARYYTQEEGQKKQMELMGREQELTALKEDLSNKLAEEEHKMNLELKKRISDFLKKQNNQKQYHFILGYSDLTNILYANDSLDITNTVINGLNLEYKTEKQNK
jgi:outer membrane protein